MAPPAPEPPSALPASGAADPARPLLGIRGYAVTVHDKPSEGSRKLGYLRAGALVARNAEPESRRGCPDGWYRIAPAGYVCAGRDATTRLDDPVLRAAHKRPRLDRPLPYRYGFVRAVLPYYLRIPTAKQQYKSEFKLAEHLEWFREHKDEVQRAELGADDVPVDARGVLLPGKRLGEIGSGKSTAEMSLGELFGGAGDDDPPPFWLRGGDRLIPNISGFDVPELSVFADRARRHTGLAFIGSFATGPEALRRRFAITTDLRLAPTSKVKPDAGSAWHGVELGGALVPPLAFVRLRGAQAYTVDAATATAVGPLERRSVQPLSGKVARIEGERYYELAGGRWARSGDVGVVVAPRKWPGAARRGEKWIEVDLSEQTLVLWNGNRAEYATLVSTGRPGVGDPLTTNATARGSFRVYAKHVTITMDSDEGASLRHGGRAATEAAPSAAGDPDYVPRKGDGVYGVTLRRGHGLFKLRDVPWVQYFHQSYALHGAYWHDVFGIPRSHGCINLSPVDAHRVFAWTEPALPEGWHAVNADEGTVLIVHK
jgi:lipoprotein-anchoring transpeptidase ErfK/SrfK